MALQASGVGPHGETSLPLLHCAHCGYGRGHGPIVIVGCHRHAALGVACNRPDALVCTAPDRALVCRAATFWEIACGGPRGCQAETGVCDTSVGVSGDTCPVGTASFACTADRASALVCDSGHFKLWRACRGPLHCSASDDAGVQCDTSLGQIGDSCARANSEVCSIDGRTLLRCDGQTLKPASSCRGPDACRVHRDDATTRCDDSVAVEGIPCSTPRRVACSIDGRMELVCANGAFATSVHAAGPRVRSTTIACSASSPPGGSHADPRRR